jgi:hypothetical protein
VACPVCGTRRDTGALLLDTRLRERFFRHTCTGFNLCLECKRKQKLGYIALIEAQGPRGASEISPEEALRTGRVFHIKESAWPNVFRDAPVPPKRIAFIDEEAANLLVEMFGGPDRIPEEPTDTGPEELADTGQEEGGANTPDGQTSEPL